MTNDYDVIPQPCRDALIRHILFGDEVGDFVTAVLRNDLAGAVERADHINIGLLPLYVGFLNMHAPKPCWGGDGFVRAWREARIIEAMKPGKVDWPNNTWHGHAERLFLERR